MYVPGKAVFGLAAPLFLALIALFLGNKDTPIQIGDSTYTVRPLRLAMIFLLVDLMLFLGMYLAGIIRF